MSKGRHSTPGRTTYAVRGAAAFGLTALAAFALSAWHAIATGEAQSNDFLAVGTLCGIIGGLAYGRRLLLPLVLGLGFGLTGFLFLMQEGRSILLISVISSGLVTAFVFWVIGGCATITLPSKSRFDGAKAFAIPGGFAGMAYQLIHGPVRSLLDPAGQTWWGKLQWEHFLLWSIAGIGGGWLFGRELDHPRSPSKSRSAVRKTNRWAVVSTMLGGLGLGMGAACLIRDRLPLGLVVSLSPAWSAGDWFLSWGVLVAFIGAIGLVQTSRSTRNDADRRWAIAGTAFAGVLVCASLMIVSNPLKPRFNTKYAERLLRDHGRAGDAEFGYATYTGNLIHASTALDAGDVNSASRYLLEAATTTGFRSLGENGPDVTVVRSLLQLGHRDTVLEFLLRSRNFWPQGTPVLARWETAIRAGRQPNFNNRVIPAVDISPANIGGPK